MHQNTSFDVQIFLTGGGYTLRYPAPHAALPHGIDPRCITESGTIPFTPATFYKSENPRGATPGNDVWNDMNIVSANSIFSGIMLIGG